jgi:hypothetical protein
VRCNIRYVTVHPSNSGLSVDHHPSRERIGKRVSLLAGADIVAAFLE